MSRTMFVVSVLFFQSLFATAVAIPKIPRTAELPIAQLYTKPYFKGWQATITVDGNCTSLEFHPSLDKNIYSIQTFLFDGCIQLYKTYDCSGEFRHIHGYDFFDLGDWNGVTSSIGICTNQFDCFSTPIFNGISPLPLRIDLFDEIKENEQKQVPTTTELPCVSCLAQDFIWAWLSNDTELCVANRSQLIGLQMKMVLRQDMEDLCPDWSSSTTTTNAPLFGKSDHFYVLVKPGECFRLPEIAEFHSMELDDSVTSTKEDEDPCIEVYEFPNCTGDNSIQLAGGMTYFPKNGYPVRSVSLCSYKCRRDYTPPDLSKTSVNPIWAWTRQQYNYNQLATTTKDNFCCFYLTLFTIFLFVFLLLTCCTLATSDNRRRRV